MTRLRIAVDMDDVLVDFVPTLLSAIRTRLGVDVPFEAVTSWDMQNGALAGVDFPGGGSWMDWLQAWPAIWLSAPPVPGALPGMRSLRHSGHELEILTCKPAWAEHVVWSFVDRHGVRPHKVTILPPGASKMDCSDADVLIDDATHNCLPWAGGWGWGPGSKARPAILFDRPWNRDTVTQPNLLPARGWDAVLGRVYCLQRMGLRAAA